MALENVWCISTSEIGWRSSCTVGSAYLGPARLTIKPRQAFAPFPFFNLISNRNLTC